MEATFTMENVLRRKLRHQRNLFLLLVVALTAGMAVTYYRSVASYEAKLAADRATKKEHLVREIDRAQDRFLFPYEHGATLPSTTVEGHYLVQKGETLWSIHRDMGLTMPWWDANSSGWWPTVIKANPEVRKSNGHALRPGQKLVLVDQIQGFPLD